MGHGPRDPFDVRGQRRVQLDMGDRMFADNIHHARACLFRVVQVRQPVGEPWPKVQQGAGGLAGHTVVPIRRPRRHALLQDKDRPHAGHVIQRGNKVHFRRAGIGETGIKPTIEQRLHKAIGPVHLVCIVLVAHVIFLVHAETAAQKGARNSFLRIFPIELRGSSSRSSTADRRWLLPSLPLASAQISSPERVAPSRSTTNP